MIDTLRLESADADLLLSWTDHAAGDWCQVELKTTETQLQLGAEAKHIVFERLARGLSDRIGESTDGIDEAPATWVLSLAEKHHSIYVTDNGGHRRFHVQGPNGSLVATFELISAERLQWKRELESRG